MRSQSKSLSPAVAALAVLVLSCGDRYTGPFRDPNAPVIPSFADSAFGSGSKWFAGRTFDTITAAAIDAQSFYSAEFSAASGGALVALNLTNGAHRWTKTVPASRSVVSVSGTAAAVSSSVLGFDATTGAAKFTYQPATARFVTSNGASDGVQMFVGNASGEVVALDPATGTEAWKLQVDTASVRAVAVTAGTVYAGGNGFLAAVSLAGALQWKRVTTETPRPFVVFAPAIDSGRVTAMTLTGTTSGMANYDATTGAFRWAMSGSVPTPNTEVPGQPACDAKLITSSAGAITALNAFTGATVWSRGMSSFVTVSASCSYGAVISNALFGVAGAFRNDVQVLRASDGTALAQYPKAAGQVLRVHRVLRSASTVYFLTDKGVTAIPAP